MKTIKGPAVFLAQFADKSEPFNTLDGICKWASGLGYKGNSDTYMGKLTN